MHKVLLLVLLASFVGSAAAATPSMAYSSPFAPVEARIYVASNNIFPFVCDYCAARGWTCSCVINPPAYIDPALLSCPPVPSDPPMNHSEIVVDLRPVAEFNADYTRRQLSVDMQLRHMDENATTVRSATVLAHVLDTYAVGDRRPPTPQRAPSPPHVPSRPTRQMFLPSGYVCDTAQCGRSFDYAYKLKRHQKQHLTSSERHHKCSFCNEGFLYPKDLIRHQKTHIKQPQSFCGSCHKGFSRNDNRVRHERKQHPQP